MKGQLLLLVIILSSILAACSGTNSSEPEPPVVHYGEDICEFCGMIISEERFAAGYITEDGQEHIFDDIGGMIQAHLQSQQKIAVVFVHDYPTHTWIRAEKAHYVLSEGLPTPMLSGLAAFASTDEAETFINQFNGQRLTFNELLAHYRDNPPTPVLSNSNN